MSTRRAPRSKTAATWLAFLGGALGLHRFYLHGWRDPWGWLLIPASVVGAWGALRMRALGTDDVLGSWLVPLLGIALAASMLEAVVHGLTPRERWLARHDPEGRTRAWPWLDVLGAIGAAAIGAIVLISTLAFVAQRGFEWQAAGRAPAAAAPR